MAPLNQVLLQPVLSKALVGHKGSITGLCFEPNKKQLVTSSEDHSLILWNLKERKEAYRFTGHTAEVTDVCYSPDGRFIASSSADKTVRLWTGSLRTNDKAVKAHLNVVRSIHISPDSQCIVTASDDKSVKTWNASRRKFETCFSGHYSWVRCARFSSDGRTIASCSDDKTTKLFDRSSGLCYTTFKELSGRPNKLEFHPNDKYLAVGLSNGIVRLYDTRNNRQPVQQHHSHDNVITSLSFFSSGNYLLTASNDSSIKIIDVAEARPVYSMAGHTGPITAAAFSADGSMIASGGKDKKLLFWNVNSVYIKDPNCILGEHETKIADENLQSDRIFGQEYKENVKHHRQSNAKETVMDILQCVNQSLSKLTYAVTDLEKRLAKLETNSSRRSSCRCTQQLR